MSGTDVKQRADYSGRRVQRPSRWWIPVLTFILGGLVGVLTVGLLGITGPDFLPRQTSTPPATPSPTGGQSVPVAASAQVNAACLRVINDAQDVSIMLSEVGPAASAVNLQQLDDIVRRLQSVQPLLKRDLADCRVEPSAGGTPSAEPPTSPTPVPTAVATR
ncbi:MAG: hypothetical protein ACJ72M_17935 [Propionibacteriaceae bacterium]